MKRLTAFLVIGAAILGHGTTHAQFYNPRLLAAQNQASQQQWYMQQMLQSQAAQSYANNYYQALGYPYYSGSQIAAWQSAAAWAPVYNAYNYGYGYPQTYVPPGGINPYAANPYSPASAGYGANPYTPGVDPYGGSNPYSPYNPYNNYNSPVSSYLYGQSDVMRSYGKVINDQETARILREQALQAKLETKKKAFDLEMYIKANTPTYTQEQERKNRETLRRLQTISLPGEIANGKSLNFLIDDLRKFPGKKIALEPLNLSEGVLSHLNVTKNTFGMGLLRDDGKVTWPAALLTDMTVKQRKDLDEQLRNVVKSAYGKGGVNQNLLRDLRQQMDKMREDLIKRVNDTPTAQYLDAKRFLQEFHEASVALEKGEAPLQAEFQRYIEGGRSVQEVADYMVRTGLRFGPATADDEPAYRAVYSALATYDIAMNGAAGERDQ